MNRLNLVLMAAVLASGLVLVHSAFDARSLFTHIEDTRTETHQLDSDYQRLQAERRAQATNLRVEQVARDRLGMRPITPAVTQTVSDSMGAAAASAASAGGAR